jgi:hypothetical protein
MSFKFKIFHDDTGSEKFPWAVVAEFINASPFDIAKNYAGRVNLPYLPSLASESISSFARLETWLSDNIDIFEVCPDSTRWEKEYWFATEEDAYHFMLYWK